MRKLICLLSLVIGCNSCYVAPPQPAHAAPSHDVVSMEEVMSPPVSSIVPIEPVKVSAAPPKAIARHVLIIGDSVACAVSPVAKEVAQEWAQKTGQPTDDVTVDCKGGTTIQYWGPGLHAHFSLQARPLTDTLLVFLGTNHYWQKTVPNPQLILDLVTNRNLTCVWVGNVAVKGKHWPINGLLRDAVTPTCIYFDSEAEPIQLCDGFHPDSANAKKWLTDVWAAIPLKYEETHD